jgi:hypothetical protein
VNIIKKSEYDALVAELEDIFETMEIPEKRADDYRWLSRNLDVANGAHPQLGRARDILRILLRGEVL